VEPRRRAGLSLRALSRRVDVGIDLLGIAESDRATLDVECVPIIAVDDPGSR